MVRDHRSDQALRRPPALRIVPGELVASHVEPLPAARSPVRPLWPPLAEPLRRVAGGRVVLWTIGGLVASAAAGGVVWLAVEAVTSLIAAVTALVTAVVAWVQAHMWHLGFGGAALLFLLIRPRAVGSSCGGLHCGGCRR